MKKTDISAKFNPFLSAALAEGFAPDLTELCGSYSGVMGSQIVLARGNERMVFWMEEHHGSHLRDVPNTVNLYVSRFAIGKGETCEFTYMWPSNWKEHLVAHVIVYEVSSRKGGWYVDDADEAAKARVVHRSRYGNKYYTTSFRECEVNDRLLAIARRLRGFKTIRCENLHVYKTGRTWVFQNKLSHREVMVG